MSYKHLIATIILAAASNAYADPHKPAQTNVDANASANAHASAHANASAAGNILKLQNANHVNASSNNTNNSSLQQAQTAMGGSSSNSNSINVEGDDFDPAASSAVAPSVGTVNDCQIATPSSKAVSIIFISVSGTTGVTYNPLCYAYKRGQMDVADKLMCQYSQEYAKANPKCATIAK